MGNEKYTNVVSCEWCGTRARARALASTNLTSSGCVRCRLNYTQHSYYHYPFKHVKCVLQFVAIVSPFPWVVGFNIDTGYVSTLFLSSIFCCWAFQSHPDRTRWNFVSDAVRMQLPIITMGYMSCLAKVFSKVETGRTHVFAQMHDEKWHMRRTKQERTRETLVGGMPSTIVPANERFSFSLSLVERSQKRWTPHENKENNLKWRETCVMSAINLNLPFI